LRENKAAREMLSLQEGEDPSDWVVITAYYAMYMAALALLAMVNYRSSNHTATVMALDELFVKKRLLEPVFLKMLRRASLEKDYIELFVHARDQREMAQYGVARSINGVVAEHQMRDAYAFIKRIEELLDGLGARQDGPQRR